jgi:hypothetical protein
MPREKKAPSAPTKANEAPAKPVVSVNPEPSNGGVKSSALRTPAPKASAPKASTQNPAAPKTSGMNTGAKMNGDLEAAIRARAYQIYEERGRTDGLAHEDWVRAEREIVAQHEKRSA